MPAGFQWNREYRAIHCVEDRVNSVERTDQFLQSKQPDIIIIVQRLTCTSMNDGSS